jgi:hypothetical protein
MELCEVGLAVATLLVHYSLISFGRPHIAPDGPDLHGQLMTLKTKAMFPDVRG